MKRYYKTKTDADNYSTASLVSFGNIFIERSKQGEGGETGKNMFDRKHVCGLQLLYIHCLKSVLPLGIDRLPQPQPRSFNL